MKWLKYKQKVKVKTKDEKGNPIEKEFLRTKVVKDNEKGRAMAASEAVGEVIEKNDGKTVMPTDKERLEALERAVLEIFGVKEDSSFLAAMVQMGRITMEQVPPKHKKLVATILENMEG